LLQRGWDKPQSSEVENRENIQITIRKYFECGVNVVEQRSSEKEILTLEASRRRAAE
jgi:hypothetical protein